MKGFFNVLVVTLLAMAVGLARDTYAANSKDVELRNFRSAQAQVKADEVAVSIALPALADIFWKGGNSSSGQVMEIDAQEQTLSIQRSGRSASIRLSKIDKVVFKNGAAVYRSDGRQIIRGERERPVGSQETWSGVTLSTFDIQNPSQGLAVVRLSPPVVSTAKLRGIQQVARDRQYVVDEIRFNPEQGTMTILATPY
jgi:hypothetical protein